MFAGGTQVTNAAVSPADASVVVGIPGTAMVGNVALLLAPENALVPTALVAATAKVYEVPLTRPALLVSEVCGKPFTGAVTITSGNRMLLDAEVLRTV